MTLIVDASVAALWVLDQSGSDRASTLSVDERLIAPSLIVAEMGSAIWRAVRRGDVPDPDAPFILEAALEPIDALIPLRELHTRALELAIQLKHPIYDCFYLALAERERAPLITADERLIRAAADMKSVEVRRL